MRDHVWSYLSILVESCSTKNSADWVAIPNSVVNVLDDEHTQAIATSIAIGARVEGVTTTVWAQESERVEPAGIIRG